MNSINYTKRLSVLMMVFAVGFGFFSCDDDDDQPSAQVIWNIDLNAKLENPGVPGRNETGGLEMILYSDRSLSYYFSVDDLKSGDVLTMAHIHAGDPLTNGPIVLNFNPAFSGNAASGTLMLTESFADSLVNGDVELYFNVHSQEVPAGLVRGQVNSDILLASDVVLSGDNEVPPVQTTAGGLGSLRLATNKKLYSKVTVSNLESTDSWTMAHIHAGTSETTGGILVTLCDDADDFGVKKVTTLNGETISKLLNDSTYVNAHSTLHGSGAIRGQVKNESKFHDHY